MTTAYATDPRFALHTIETHPEHAGRLHAVNDAMAATGLAARVDMLSPREAARESLLAVHTRDHVDRLAATQDRPARMYDLDTYVTPYSYEAARLAVGAALAVTDAVLSGSAANGLAAVRPPGHHATPSRAMGFCLLNNIAIAARHAKRQHRLARVAIVDIDVHHGNGTQSIFFDDPSVLFLSTHQSPLYPGTGALTETGDGPGVGTTINIPLPPGVGDYGFSAALDRVVIPAVRRFEPELLLISAGFDAHWTDPLAQLALSLDGYDAAMRRLVNLAGEVCLGRVIVVLEGGYHLRALAAGWCNTVRALLGGDHRDDPLGPAPRPNEPDIDALIGRVRKLHNLP